MVGQIGDGVRSIASARGHGSRSRRRGANVLLTLHPSAHAARTQLSTPFCHHPSPPRSVRTTTTYHPRHCQSRICTVDLRRRLTYLKDTDSGVARWWGAFFGPCARGGEERWGARAGGGREISENNAEQFREIL